MPDDFGLIKMSSEGKVLNESSVSGMVPILQDRRIETAEKKPRD